MKRLILVFLPFCFAQLGRSQQISGEILSLDTVRSWVLENHPLAKQARLQQKRGTSNLMLAKGNFDPKIEASFNNIFFRNQEYNNLMNANIKIPTPSPIELKAGFEMNSGNYYNPENNTPDDGLILAGISMPLLQGMITDERRTSLRQAEAFQNFSLQQQEIMINELLLSTYNQYWAWWLASQKVGIGEAILRLAKDRYDGVLYRALSGDLPLIDTLEAFTQKQNREQQLQELYTIEIKERLLMSSLLWSKNDESGFIISDGVKPSLSEKIDNISVLSGDFTLLRNSITENNPWLNQYTWKFDALKAEERLKREKIKPKFNVNYNLLAQTLSNADDGGFGTNNYKWGIDFSFPIFVRQGRGDLQLTKIKILETQYDFQQKKQDVTNKSSLLYESIRLVEKQKSIAADNLKNYSSLLEGEKDKFFNGESSLFMVNQREQQFAEAEFKVVELQTKLKVLENELLFLLGVIK